MPARDRKGTSREDEGVGWGRSREAATVLELPFCWTCRMGKSVVSGARVTPPLASKWIVGEVSAARREGRLGGVKRHKRDDNGWVVGWWTARGYGSSRKRQVMKVETEDCLNLLGQRQRSANRALVTMLLAVSWVQLPVGIARSEPGCYKTMDQKGRGHSMEQSGSQLTWIS